MHGVSPIDIVRWTAPGPLDYESRHVPRPVREADPARPSRQLERTTRARTV